MLAFLPLTLAATLQEDVTQQFATPPQVGYAFASLCMGSEDGENSFVEGSRAHIIAAAKVLAEHPEARVLIEGHVGVSAPPEVAQQFSEHRAHIVAQILEEDFGICGGRIETRGWGSSVAAAAQSSAHPNARAAKGGYGWAEIFFFSAPEDEEANGAGGQPALYPPRPDYYPRPEASPPPPPAPRARPATRPIFYMFPGASVGEEVRGRPRSQRHRHTRTAFSAPPARTLTSTSFSSTSTSPSPPSA